MKRFPSKFPAEVFSVLGPLPVIRNDDLVEDREAFGETHFRPRTIVVDGKKSSPETRWSTLFHEMTHVALWDGGVHQSLTHEQREGVCDAMGTYLAAAVRAGFLKLLTPKAD
jgi:hypothetical protein